MDNVTKEGFIFMLIVIVLSFIIFGVVIYVEDYSDIRQKLTLEK